MRWLEAFVANRGSMQRASRDLGHADNWASRIIARKIECNWDFADLEKMASALRMTPLQVDECIRSGIIPAAPALEKKPRAKPRRAERNSAPPQRLQAGTEKA